MGGFMATKYAILLFMLIGCVIFLPSAQAAGQVSVAVNTGDFAFLTNYGTWVDVSGYGRVWHPRVVSGWRPFMHGEWVRSDEGWMWNSTEPYGWAVYHYGNWVDTPKHGWVWVPGYEYSPARVRWIHYGDYAGWAPLPPAGVTLVDPWINARYWNVVPARYLTVRNVHTYFVARPVAPVRTVTVVRTAPEFAHIERVTNRRVEVVHVNTTEVQGGKYKFKKVEVVHSNPAHTTVTHKTVVKEKQGKKHGHPHE